MKIYSNQTFKTLLSEFDIPHNLLFQFDLPKEVKEIVQNDIIETEYGITFKKNNSLYQPNKKESKSIIEDNENHFHVDWFLDNATNQEVFKLGIKTILLLAKRIESKRIHNIRLSYSFQTSSMGKNWAIKNGLHEKGDEHYISDRLSFHTKRKGEEVISVDNLQNMFWAILVVDVG